MLLTVQGERMPTPTILQRVEAARRHLQMSIDWKGETLGVLETRRHYTNYFKGIPHFKEYRTRLVTSNASEDVFATLADVEREWGDYVMA